MELRACPFCGKKIKEGYPYFSFISGHGVFHLSHNCDHPEGQLGVCIDIYGKTAQEVYDKWNGGAA